jgi:hypothetical protein
MQNGFHAWRGRMRQFGLLCLALAPLAGAVLLVTHLHRSGGRALPAIQTERLLVGAHYYVWYPQNFKQGYLRGELQPPQSFAVGRYRQHDPKVIEQQIAWCSQYGIDFLTVDWWPGARKDRDAFLDAFLNAKNIADIRFCVFYETWGLGFDKDFGCTRFDRENVASRALWQWHPRRSSNGLCGRLRRGAEEAQFSPAAAITDGEADVGILDGLALLAEA